MNISKNSPDTFRFDRFEEALKQQLTADQFILCYIDDSEY